MKELKILYLAHDLPEEQDYDKESLLPNQEYHLKLYETLKDLADVVISIRDFKYIDDFIDDIDIIYSVYNQAYFKNSEIFVASYAEYKGVAYIGAPPNIRAIAEDKHLTKFVASHLNIPVLEWTYFNVGEEVIEPDFEPPYFVKPRYGANSKGLSEKCICENWDDVIKVVQDFYESDIDVIIEKFIVGDINTVPVLDNFGDPIILSPVHIESDSKNGIITEEQKKRKAGTRAVSQSNSINEEISAYAESFFNEIRPCDYARFDFITCKETNKSYLLELNICCNLGEHASFYTSASSNGISYEQLIKNILHTSIYRQFNNKESLLKSKIKLKN